MIHAVLAAQFAKPLVKWGAIVGGIALVFGIGHVRGCVVGEDNIQTKWDAAISKQAQESALQVIAEAKMSNEVLKEQAENVRDAVAVAAPIKQEVRRYEPTKPCDLDPEFVRLFDAVSSLSEPHKDGLPASDASAGEPIEPSAAEPEAAEGVQQDQAIEEGAVLLAYYDAVEYAMFLWIDYSALVQWERGRFIVQQTQREADQ